MSNATIPPAATARPSRLWQLVNSHDEYTFRADSLEVAGMAARIISETYGAAALDGGGERIPMFGWDEWCAERGMYDDWMLEHSMEVVEELKSFMLVGADKREWLETCSPDVREAFYQNNRTGMDDVLGTAQRWAEFLERC